MPSKKERARGRTAAARAAAAKKRAEARGGDGGGGGPSVPPDETPESPAPTVCTPCRRSSIPCLELPCLKIIEGSELHRVAGEFLVAKRGNGPPCDLGRASGALQSRLKFEATLKEGDPRLGTRKCDEVAAVAPAPERPTGPPPCGSGVIPSVVVASLGDPASSTAVAVANEGQARAHRAAIDSLVGSVLPAGQMPAYHLLMDQYAAFLGGQRR
ncbi:hypothetical protein LY78DRAFT_589693 [Colletotrichum sublineola]|nr:hypothetical protein LY78DRAFT_589693 [Colletotrichum sublineola]